MNKIYKVVWSKTKGCYIVVSEFAKRNTKASSTGIQSRQSLLSKLVTMSLSVLVLGSAALGVVQAKETIYSYDDNGQHVIKPNNSTWVGDHSIYLNPDSSGSVQERAHGGSGKNSVVLGYGAKNDPLPYGAIADNAVVVGGDTINHAPGAVVIGSGASNVASNAVVIGNSANIEAQNADNATFSVVIGDKSRFSDNPWNVAPSPYLSGQGVAVGSKVIATSQATALGNDVYAIGRSSIALGSDDITSYRDKITSYDYEHYFQTLYGHIDATGEKYGYGSNSGSIVSWEGSNGDPTHTYGNLQTKYSPTLAQGDGSIAIGSRSLAYDAGSTALGTLAFALKKGATAVGTQTRSEGVGSIALGSHTAVFADNSVGTGNNIQILKPGGMAYGYKGYAGGENAIAIGSNVYANTLMNYGTSVQSQDGTSYSVFQDNRVGPGAQPGVLYADLKENAAIASGESERAVQFENTNSFFKKAIAGGKTYLEALESVLDKDNVISPITQTFNGVENVVQKSGQNALVLGSDSAAIGDNSIALGHGSFALNKNNFALGSFAFSNADNAMAIGLTSRALAENSLALGVGTSTSKEAKSSIAIGTGSVNYGATSTLVGNSSTISMGDHSLLFGYHTDIMGNDNIGLGNEIKIKSYNNTSTRRNVALGNNVQIGNGANESLAIGTDTKLAAGTLDNPTENDRPMNHALALGYKASVVRGTAPLETGNSSMAIGSNASASLENSVALGTNSLTDYTADELNQAPWVVPGAIAIPTSTKTGVVSVGSKGQERRIVNVASGALDTDVVNVGQLKMVAERLGTDIDFLKNGTGINYFSIENKNPAGDAGKLASQVAVQNNYDYYIKLKQHLLTYEARQKLNGETFNEEVLKQFKDKIQEIEAQNPKIAETASSLKAVTIPNGSPGNNDGVFKETLKTIQNAYKEDSVRNVPPMTREELAKLEAASNYDNLGAKGSDSIAIGYGASTPVGADNAIAMGTFTTAKSQGAVALGSQSKVETGSDYALAAGANATVSEGMGAAIAIGDGANVSADLNVATNKGTNGIAIGKNAKVYAANSVAIGADSVATMAAGDPKAGVSLGGSYPTFTGTVSTPNLGVVSLGSTGKTRRVTNVAAGLDDTDAVNVAQLKTLAANKIFFAGDSTTTTGIALGDTGNPSPDRMTFGIKGDGDISSTAAGTTITLGLNKGAVAAGETKVVTGKAVYDAIAAAKPTIVAQSGSAITVSGSKTPGILGDTFTLDVDVPTVVRNMGDTFAKKDGSNIDVDSWRTKLDIYSKSETDTLVDKAKNTVSAGPSGLVTVSHTGENPRNYVVDLSTSLQDKLSKVPDDLSGELAKKEDKSDFERKIQEATNKSNDKLDKNLSNLDTDGANKIQDLAGDAVKVVSANEKIKVTSASDNHVKTYTLTVDESKFDKEKIQNLLGGVTSSISGEPDSSAKLPTAGAVKEYLGNLDTRLTNKGFKVADASNEVGVKLGETVKIVGSNGLKTTVAPSAAGGATLSVGLDEETAGKVNNALSVTGDNLGDNKDTLLSNLGLNNLGSNYATVTGDNILAGNKALFRNNLSVYSQEETTTAINKAKSTVAVVPNSGLSVSSDDASGVGPTTYTLDFDNTLKNKLAKLPTDVTTELAKKATVEDLATKANKDLSNLVQAGKDVIAKEAVKAVTVSATGESNPITVTAEKNEAGTTVNYKLSFDASKLDGSAVKDLIGGVTDVIPATGDPDNTKLPTAKAVQDLVDQVKTKGFKVTSNDGVEETVQLGKTFTVQGDGTYLTGATTGSDGSATVTLNLASSIKSKLDNLPANTNEELEKKLNKDLSNIDPAANSKIKDIAGEGVVVAKGSDKVTVTENTDDHVKTYTVDVDETQFDGSKIKNLIGGVANTLTGTDGNNAVTTVGAVKEGLTALQNKGIKVNGNNNSEQTVALGKTLSIVGDGTTVKSTVASANGGAALTFTLSDDTKHILDNALLKDGSNLEPSPQDKAKLQAALGVDNLDGKYAKLDASNLTGEDGKWRTALKVSSTTEMNAAIKDASAIVKGDSKYVEVSSEKAEGGPTTYTVKLSSAVDEKFNSLGESVSTGLDTKANKDLGNIGEAGNKVITDLAQGAVKVAAADQTVTVDTDTSTANVTTYKVKVNTDSLDGNKIKDLIGGVATDIDKAKENTTDHTKPDGDSVVTANAVDTYVTNEVTKLKNSGFKIASNTGNEQTVALGSTVTVKGDGATLSGTVSQEGTGATVSLGLSQTYKDKIDNAATEAEYKAGTGINAEAWKNALKVGEIPLTYKANDGQSYTTKLQDGLNFVNGNNILASITSSKDVRFDLSPTLTGITSIAGTGETPTTMTFTPSGVQLNNKRITGLKDGVEATDAVTMKQYQHILDLLGTGGPTTTTGGDGTPPKPDPNLNQAGNEGNPGGGMQNQINSLLNGLSGNFVYTAPNGDRLEFDPSTQSFKDKVTHEVVELKDIIISAVSAKDGTTHTPTILNNVASALDLTGSNKENDGGTPSKPLAIDEAKAKEVVSGPQGLLTKAGVALNRASTLADLQALGQAGFDFKANSDKEGKTDSSKNSIHRPIGTQIGIEGKKDATYTANEYADENLVTYVDVDSSQPENKTLRIAMKKSPTFAGLTLGPDGKQITITPSENGEGVTLARKPAGSDGDTKVTISGIKDDPNDPTSAVTKKSLDEVKTALGLDGQQGATGNTGSTGPAGKDGLDKTTILTKLQAQRAGTSGAMVYTDNEGKRLVNVDGKYYKAKDGMVQGNDGKWYTGADQLDSNGKPITSATAIEFGPEDEVTADKVLISAVNANGETTAPTTLQNLKSALDIVPSDTAMTATDAQSKTKALLKKTGAVLNTAATLGDLQAVAQAGLDFAGNVGVQDHETDNSFHRELGKSVSIVGAKPETYTGTDYSADNLVTVADPTAKTITIQMKKAPTFTGLTLKDGDNTVKLTPTESGALHLDNGSGQGVAITGIKDDVDDDTAAVTKKTFKDAMARLGVETTGATGAQGQQGPAGKDGLNGTNMSEKVTALRQGTAGTVVYTDAEGHRLTEVDGKYYNTEGYTRANNGKWYRSADVKSDGEPTSSAAQAVNFASADAIPVDKIQLRTVNPDGETTKPVTLGNVAHALARTQSMDLQTITTEDAKTLVAGEQGLYSKTGSELNRVATLGDLQALAAAGLTYTVNSDSTGHPTTIDRALGNKLAIVGKATEPYSADTYDASNVVTYTDPATEGANITIALKSKPNFKGVNIGDGTDKVSITSPDGNTLQVGTDGNPVVIKGIKDGDTNDSAVTKKTVEDLKKELGLVKGDQGATGESGPAGADGLDGSSIVQKVDAQRDGLSGTMVYTDDQGNRLVAIGGKYYKASDVNGFVRGKDGNFYPADSLNADGSVKSGKEETKKDVSGLTEVGKDKIRITAVNPLEENGAQTTKPVVVGNVASGLSSLPDSNGKLPGENAVTGDNAKALVAGATGDGTSGLLAAKGAVLSNAANVGDLQVLAQAGLDFGTNQTNSTIHSPLGTKVNVVGGAAYTTETASNYSDANVMTTTEGSTIKINLAKKPEFSGLKLQADGGTAVTITPGADGSLTLSKEGASGDDSAVELKNIKDGTDPTSAVTVGQLNKLKADLGLAANGAAGSAGAAGQGSEGPAGKDGLDGKSILEKVQAVRDGMTGTMVYTTEEGDRVTRVGDDFYKTEDLKGKKLANDNKWYPAEEVGEDGQHTGSGTAVAALPQETKILISAVDGKDGATTTPTAIGNVASGLGLAASETPITKDAAVSAITKADTGLLNLKGASLQRVATVGDLQALAQGGLDFVANKTKDAEDGANVIHRTLGTALPIQGKKDAQYTDADYSTDNMVSFADTGTLRIAMKKNPEFTSVSLGDSSPKVKLTVDEDGNLNLSSEPKGAGDGKVVIKGLKEGTGKDSVATKGSIDEVKKILGIDGKDGAAGETGAAGEAGKNGVNGPSSKDGLNGASVISKVQAQRDGTSGNMVYTTKAGERLVKVGDKYYKQGDLVQAKDGKWYGKDDVQENGLPKEQATAHSFTNDSEVTPENIVISTVNADGTTTTPTTLANVASGLGLTGHYSASSTGTAPEAITADAAKTAISGNDGLLTKSGADLNKAATVGDLQALAQAGVNVAATVAAPNTQSTTVHLPMGNTLTIQGDTTATYEAAKYDVSNLVTVADSDAKTVTVQMKKTPTFTGLEFNTGDNKPKITITATDDGIKLGKDPSQGADKDKVSISGIKEGAGDDSAVTKSTVDEIKQLLGLDGKNGSDGTNTVSPGPAGKDGLDGKGLVDKIEGLRNGMGGTMVYTDKDGNRLARVGDKLYKAEDIKGKVLKEGTWRSAEQPDTPLDTQPTALDGTEPVYISTVNGLDGSTTTVTKLANVGSALGLPTVTGSAPAQALTADAAKEAVKKLTGTVDASILTSAVNGQDLQAVAQAGLDVTANKISDSDENNKLHLPLGSTLAIEGAENARFDSNYSSDNVATKIDGTTVRIGIKTAPKFDKVSLGEGENVISLTADESGNLLTLTNKTTGTANPSGVELNGVKAGTKDDSAVNKSQLDSLKNILGVSDKATPTTERSDSNSPAGKDGLDGQSALNKIYALRQGTAGTMVYTDESGNRLVKDGTNFYKASDLDGLKKGNDGKWYNAADLDQYGNPKEGKEAQSLAGKELPSTTKVIISAVNSTGETVTPISLGNVASGLGLTGKADNSADPTGASMAAPEAINATAAKAVVAGDDGLITKSGKALTAVATVGDLQALAQAGFDVTTNIDKEHVEAGANVIHTTLGQGFNIIGDDVSGKYTRDDYSSDNIATFTEDNRTIRIAMKSSPKFDDLTLGTPDKEVKLTPDGNGGLKLGTGGQGTDPVVITNVKDSDDPNSVATKSDVDEIKTALGLTGDAGARGLEGQTGTAGKDGMNGTSAANKIEAQRNGLTGNMVYTDKDGNRLVKVDDKFYPASLVKDKSLKLANDGKWYPATNVDTKGNVIGDNPQAHDFSEDASAVVDPKTVIISAVNPEDGATVGTGKGVVIGNVAQNLVPKENETAQQVVAGTDGKSGLLAQTKGLDRAATVGDLKVLAEAGTTFTSNAIKDHDGENTFVAPIGTTVSIVGGATNTYNDSQYSSDNLVTTADKDNRTVTIAMKKKPTFTGMSLETGTEGKKVTITPSYNPDNSETTLTLGDGNNGKVVLQGVAPSAAPDSVVTLGQLDAVNAALGNLNDEGEVGRHLPQKEDGLNNTSVAAKISAQRNGLTGTMVYTDDQGNRVTQINGKFYKVSDLNKPESLYAQGKDGNWYKKTDLKETGEPKDSARPVDPGQEAGMIEVSEDKLVISSVNPFEHEGKTSTQAPMTVANVGSGLGLGGTYQDGDNGTAYEPASITAEAAKKALNGDEAAGTPGLTKMAGSQLNRLATVGDLQAVAQGGYDFTTAGQPMANETFHAPLGSTISIRGKDFEDSVRQGEDFANMVKKSFSTENVYTYIEGANTATPIIRVAMAKSPVFDSVRFGENGPELTQDGNGKLVVKQGDKILPVATGKSGFYVKAGNDQSYFLPIGGTLYLTGDANIHVGAKDLTASPSTSGESSATDSPAPATGNSGDSSVTTPAVGTGGTSPAPVSGGVGTTETAPSTVEGGTPAVNPSVPATTGVNPGSKAVAITSQGKASFESVKITKDIPDDAPADTVITKGYLDKTVGKSLVQNKEILTRVSEQITKVSTQANAGTASAIAAANTPTVMNTDQRKMVSVGIGNYGSESAVAFGFSGTNRARTKVYKVTGTVDSTGTYGLGAGFGMSVGSKDTFDAKKEVAPGNFKERLDKAEAVSQEIDAMRVENKNMQAEIDSLKSLIQKEFHVTDSDIHKEVEEKDQKAKQGQ